MSTVNVRRVGNRIPHHFFVTQGVGESDITVHAGSYHLALRDAGIEMCNIMTYSSIMPIGAVEIAREEYEPLHGEVMECIVADATAQAGQTAVAGIIFGMLWDSKGLCQGGLVCEHTGWDAKKVWADLNSSLDELHRNGYEHLELRDVRVIIQEVSPKKKYGTALVAICFTDYLVHEGARAVEPLGLEAGLVYGKVAADEVADALGVEAAGGAGSSAGEDQR